MRPKVSRVANTAAGLERVESCIEISWMESGNEGLHCELNAA